MTSNSTPDKVAVVTAHRPASARQPPAPWPQTATASPCWPAGSTASSPSPTNWATGATAIEADVTDRDIINISSVAGRTARSGNGVYAATKWGINGWSESLRQELLPDIRVTLIEPGVVATELPNHSDAPTEPGAHGWAPPAIATRASRRGRTGLR
jgi:NAD(P)-dependent dehydrogenase (short-subunit alcohol dehydrogenase family)